MLDEGDKAECKEIARVIVKEVLTEHIAMCPHGRAIFKVIWIAVGVGVGSGIFGSGILFTVIKMIGGV